MCGLTVAGIGFALPALAVLAAGVVTVRGGGRRVPLVVGAALLIGVALVPLVRQTPFVDSLFHGPQSGPDALGNLLRPLRVWQVLGIWPARDFRVGPVSDAATTILLVAVVAGACWGLWRAAALRAWGALAMAGILVSAGRDPGDVRLAVGREQGARDRLAGAARARRSRRRAAARRAGATAAGARRRAASCWPR